MLGKFLREHQMGPFWLQLLPLVRRFPRLEVMKFETLETKINSSNLAFDKTPDNPRVLGHFLFRACDKLN